MADSKDTHIVEIPVVEEEHRRQDPIFAAVHHHPLAEISASPGHLLLLKLWQREEDLSSRRISLKESTMNALNREIFQLSSFFFIFHGLFLTVLFASSVNSSDDRCRRWWVPAAVSLSASLAVISLVQMKIYKFWKVNKQLQREKSDERALKRCIQELRMKGSSFDLSKEPQKGKRLKSSSVEVKWKPIDCFRENVLTFVLLCFAGLLFPAFKLVLCV
ncbi:hypothetical protein NMG60_11002020 [Bertholletia excelsa]